MNKIIDLLGNRAEYYLGHTCKTIDKSLIHVPSADTIDKVWINSDRNIRTLNSLQTLLGHGRLANTGYVSILPVDQGIEHSAGASFAPNPLYFDPENIVKLAIDVLRPSDVRYGQGSMEYGSGSCRRHYLFRI